MFRTYSKFHKVPTRVILNSPGLGTECAFWVIYSERCAPNDHQRLGEGGYTRVSATARCSPPLLFIDPLGERRQAGRQAGGRCGLRRFIPVWLRRRHAHWLPRWANPLSARGLAMGFEFSCSAWSHWCAARAPTRKSQTLSRFSSFLFAGDEAQRKSIILRRSLSLASSDAYSECGIGAKASAVRRSIFLKSGADLFALGTLSASRKVASAKNATPLSPIFAHVTEPRAKPQRYSIHPSMHSP